MAGNAADSRDILNTVQMMAVFINFIMLKQPIPPHQFWHKLRKQLFREFVRFCLKDKFFLYYTSEKLLCGYLVSS